MDQALASATAAYDQLPATQTTQANVTPDTTIRPDSPIVCNSGNFYQSNYDTVVDPTTNSVYGHIDWEQWYHDGWPQTGQCLHWFNALEYHFIDGSHIWFRWNGITTCDTAPCGGLISIAANNISGDAIPYAPGRLSYDYGNNYVTQLGISSETDYCVEQDPFGGCNITAYHVNNIVN